jgi:hypothetical protein
MTASILMSLLAFTQPTSAVLTTVSGADEFTKPDQLEFESEIEIRDDEQVPIESFNLVITTDDGETVTITFAPDGTVQSVDPAEGVVGTGDIRIDQLRESLTITPVESNDAFGYGYGYGVDERTGEAESFGYGYGYGYGDGQPVFRYAVSMNSTAFMHGDYSIQLSINTGDGETVFASNEKAFEVNRPGEDRGEGPPEDLPDQVPDHVEEIHDTIREFIDGSLDGSLGEAVRDIAGNNGDSEGNSGQANDKGPSDDRRDHRSQGRG